MEPQPAQSSSEHAQNSSEHAAVKGSNGLMQLAEALAQAGPALQGEDLRQAIERAIERFKTAAIRGGVAGLTVRGGLHLMSTLFYLLRTSKPKPNRHKQKRELTLADIVRDTVRYTLFLGALGGSYVAVDEGLAILFGKERTAKWRALVAGAVAGHTVLLTGRHTRHHSLATYVLLRGLTLLIRCGNKPAAQQGSAGLIRTLLAPTRFAHGDVLLMCLASSQIVYSYIMMPGTLPPSYIRFITKQAAKEQYVWKAVREQALRNWECHPPGPLPALHGTAWHQHDHATPCEFWHAGQRCHTHALSIIPQSYLRALGVYIPVYLVPALLVHRQKLLSQPLHLLPKILTGISRSAFFLTSFISIAFGGACLGFNLTGNSTGPIIAASTSVGGLATLFEKKSRRMELALYCGSRALESFARCLHEWGVLPSGGLPVRADVLMFSVGCAAIMHCYSDANGKHRDVFKSKYLNVLDFVFGNTGVEEGRITHHPSNLALIRSVRKSLRSFSSHRLDAEASESGSSQEQGSSAPRSQSASHLALPAYKRLPCLEDDEDGDDGSCSDAAGPAHTTYTISPPPPAGSTTTTSADARGLAAVAEHTGGWVAPGVVATSGQAVIQAQLPSPAVVSSGPATVLTVHALCSRGDTSQRTSSLDMCSTPGTASSHSFSHYARPVNSSLDGAVSHSSSHSTLSSVALASVAHGAALHEAPAGPGHQALSQWLLSSLQQPGAGAAGHASSLSDAGTGASRLGAPTVRHSSSTSVLSALAAEADAKASLVLQPSVSVTHEEGSVRDGRVDVSLHAADLALRYAEDISVRGGRDICGSAPHTSPAAVIHGAAGDSFPIRRILTAPGDLSLMFNSLTTGYEEVNTGIDEAEPRVHGGSISQEHMVHGGQYYTPESCANGGRTHRRHQRSSSLTTLQAASSLSFSAMLPVPVQHQDALLLPALNGATEQGRPLLHIHKVVPSNVEAAGSWEAVADSRAAQTSSGPTRAKPVHLGAGAAAEQVPAPPAFLSSRLGRAAAGVQFAASNGVAPPSINVVHSVGASASADRVSASCVGQSSVPELVMGQEPEVKASPAVLTTAAAGLPDLVELSAKRPGSPAFMSTAARIRAGLRQEGQAGRPANSPAALPGHDAQQPWVHGSIRQAAAQGVSGCWPAPADDGVGLPGGGVVSPSVDVSLHEWSSYEQEVRLQACQQGNGTQQVAWRLSAGDVGDHEWQGHVNGVMLSAAEGHESGVGGAGGGAVHEVVAGDAQVTSHAQHAAVKPEQAPSQQHQGKKGKAKRGKGKGKHK